MHCMRAPVPLPGFPAVTRLANTGSVLGVACLAAVRQRSLQPGV